MKTISVLFINANHLFIHLFTYQMRSANSQIKEGKSW